MDYQSLDDYADGRSILFGLKDSGALPLFVLGNKDFSMELAEEFFNNMVIDHPIKYDSSISGTVRGEVLQFTTRDLSAHLNLPIHGGTTLSDKEVDNAWIIMRGEDTFMEKMASMFRNLFPTDAYLISHLMDRSL